MPGRFFLTTPIERLAELAALPTDGLKGEPARKNIAPGQEIVVLGPSGWSRMRWGIIPVGRVNARGRPVLETIVNARGETVFDKSAFAGTVRSVVPADGWYEWTGAKRRKTAWRIRRKDGGLLWFAAISDTWNGPGGIVVPQVATVTCDPSDDVREIHDRMGVILEREQLDVWVHGTEPQARALVAPLGTGKLQVESADDVDWGAA